MTDWLTGWLCCIINSSPALGGREEILQQLRLGLGLGLDLAIVVRDWRKDQVLLLLPLSHLLVEVVVGFLLDELLHHLHNLLHIACLKLQSKVQHIMSPLSFHNVKVSSLQILISTHFIKHLIV